MSFFLSPFNFKMQSMLFQMSMMSSYTKDRAHCSFEAKQATNIADKSVVKLVWESMVSLVGSGFFVTNSGLLQSQL